MPRAGLVINRRPFRSVKQLVLVIVVALAIWILILILVEALCPWTSRGDEWGVSAFAAILSLPFFLWAFLYRLRRHVILATFSLGLGFALFFLRLADTLLGWTIYFFLFGVALAVSGGIVLRAFVRTNPIEETPAESQP